MFLVIRNTAIIATILLATACVETNNIDAQVPTPVISQAFDRSYSPLAPADASLVDLVALRTAYFAANPTAEAMVLTSRRRGFSFDREGGAVFLKGSSHSDIKTRIISTEGNRICVEQKGSWAGACIEAVITAEGMRVYYKFGSAGSFFAGGSFIQTSIPLVSG